MTYIIQQATVIAASVLSDVLSEYTAKPFVISGSCKRETVANQERLLRAATTSLQKSQEVNKCQVYCVASDGDSRRHHMLISFTLHKELNETSPLFIILGSLPLFNTMCGLDDLTGDFDWKHVLKRFRNTLLWQKGSLIDGNAITANA